ncbi:MAG: hypothetical protein KC496_19705, partial [Anaerolineae bacterium]|nr:hypothetical protein [Anaerolineae bacterium]
MMIGRPAAAKTGTTTDFRDNWIMGYTPNLVVGVWVGNADNTPMVDVTGISGAGPIYNQFMRQILLGQPELDFPPPPDDVIRVEVCALSGLLPKANCPLRNVEWFIDGTQPTEYDEYYQDFAMDRRTGLLADESTPQDEVIIETFVVLPQEARDWAVRNGLRLPPIGAVVEAPDSTVGLRLLEPDPYTVFELSPMIPAESQRIRLTVGVPPGTEQVTYTLDGEILGTVGADPWDLWWTLELGEHELIAEATLSDGSIVQSDPLPFTVEEYSEPADRIVLPGE